MKHMKKIVVISLLLILLATGTLVGGMLALESMSDSADYSRELQVEESLFIRDEDKPTDQSKLRETFSVYSHEQNGGKTVLLFSDEQIRENIAARNAHELNGLTYEEAMYLINDSIVLYNTYEEIILNEPAGLPDSPESETVCIRPYRSDYTELDYGTAYWLYKEILYDIHRIIRYRLYLHDGNMRRIAAYSQDGKTVSECAFDNPCMNFSGNKTATYYATLLSDGKPVPTDPDTLLRLAKNGLTAGAKYEGEQTLLLLCTEEAYVRRNLAIRVCKPGKRTREMVYPTKELQSAEPSDYGANQQTVGQFTLLLQTKFPDIQIKEQIPDLSYEELQAQIQVGMSLKDLIERFGMPLENGWFYPSEESYSKEAYPAFAYSMGKYLTKDGEAFPIIFDETYHVLYTGQAAVCPHLFLQPISQTTEKQVEKTVRAYFAAETGNEQLTISVLGQYAELFYYVSVDRQNTDENGNAIGVSHINDYVLTEDLLHLYPAFLSRDSVKIDLANDLLAN